MIDTHCHLNFAQLLGELPAVLQRARDVGVNKFVVPGTTLCDSIVAADLSVAHNDIFAGIGIHPSSAGDYDAAAGERMAALLAETNGVVAIGEVGLDYFRLEKNPPAQIAVQKLVFSQMIALARDSSLPLILHTRDCFTDAHAQLAAEASGVPAVIHCFTGTVDEARAWLDLGCHISFTGILTYKKSAVLREVAAYAPLGRIMLETDAPYLAPEGFRGDLCEPKYVLNVAECLAAVRGISLEEVDRTTTATAQAFFGI